MTLIEIAPGVTKEEIRAKTEADYAVSPKLEAADPRRNSGLRTDAAPPDCATATDARLRTRGPPDRTANLGGNGRGPATKASQS